MSDSRDLQVLWTVSQFANYFGVQKTTVYKWISQGKVLDPNKVIKIGDRVRIHRSEAERIANKKRVEIQTKKPVAAQPVAAIPVKT